jgi:uncharacterized Fe-S radical SAM superfamily protein PflX
MMLELHAMGCHKVNLVSPSHVVAQVIAAVAIAAQRGLHLPLVHNTGGYDSPEALQLLEGIVDIYMPDMKYADPEGCLRKPLNVDRGNAIMAQKHSASNLGFMNDPDVQTAQGQGAFLG